MWRIQLFGNGSLKPVLAGLVAVTGYGVVAHGSVSHLRT